MSQDYVTRAPTTCRRHTGRRPDLLHDYVSIANETSNPSAIRGTASHPAGAVNGLQTCRYGALGRAHLATFCARVLCTEIECRSAVMHGCGRAAGLGRAVDVPWLWNTFQVVNAVIGEREPGTGDEIDDGPRGENLARVGER